MAVSVLPDRASVVVIGAGIVGNALVKHLAELGWRDVLQVDQGPLPNPGGSTGHASNFIFPVDHSKEITALTVDSIRQYKQLGVFTNSGGIEVARTPERMEELRRRLASARSWGVEAELIDRHEIKKLVPFVNEDVLLGGLYEPSVGVIDPVRGGALMRERACALGALTTVSHTEVLGIDTRHGRVTGVRTNRGDVATETVVVACGVWSPRIAAMAGAAIPLTPAVHQMIDIGPIPELAETRTEIAFPIVRDMDALMYERQRHDGMEVGSYAHRPILHAPEEIAPVDRADPSPTELPFTEADFRPQLADACDLVPDLLRGPHSGIRRAINGLLSLTPDGSPLLGETPEVGGLWSAAAVWLKEGPSVGRLLARWMTDGEPDIDLHGADIARFHPHERARAHVRARCGEAFNKTYGIVHPREQWTSDRQQRLSPFHERERALGAVFFEVGGWERPQWYESNRRLLAEYGDRIGHRPHEWDARWWSPIADAEHLAMRDRAAMIDLTAFAIFDITGPGALDYVQHMVVAQVDRPVGRIVYTPVLTHGGGFRSDLTVVRLGADRFRIVTGASDGPRDRKWFTDHLPADGSAQLADVTSAWATLGLWGPRARDILASVTADDVSDEGFAFATTKAITVGAIPVLALRISYVGDLGWELHVPPEHGAKLWDTVWEAGRPFGLVPAGIGVYGTTGRMEKGYRLMGHELELHYDPVEADLTLKRVKESEFIGKQPYLAARDTEPAAMLCTLTVDDHRSARGTERYPQGNEPVVTRDGDLLVDRKGRHSYVTSAGSGPSVGTYLLMAYLPPEHAHEGAPLAVEYMGERYPVTVAAVGRTPLFDPDNNRMKG